MSEDFSGLLGEDYYDEGVLIFPKRMVNDMREEAGLEPKDFDT